jgi:hypothetical protein
MTYECPECTNKFTSKTALCLDWKDSNKSLGCPHCGTFCLVETKSNLKQSIRSGIFAGGIVVPSAMIMGQSLSKDEPIFMFFGLAIFISCFAILFLDAPTINRNLIKSPYNKQRNTDPDASAPDQVR